MMDMYNVDALFDNALEHIAKSDAEKDSGARAIAYAILVVAKELRALRRSIEASQGITNLDLTVDPEGFTSDDEDTLPDTEDLMPCHICGGLH